MHSRFLPSSMALLGVFLAACVLPLAALQQITTRDQAPAPEPTGTGRISVVVVVADTGAAVRRMGVMLTGFLLPPRPAEGPAATVSLGGFVSSVSGGGGTSAGGVVVSGGAQPAGRVQREGETDENGRVEFAALPAGMYSVMVTAVPAGFIRSSSASSSSLRLEEGGTASSTIRLERGGAITGRVVDDTGEPVTRASVAAYVKRGGSNPAGAGVNAAPASTDDRGHYRIYGLASGDYYLVASYFNPMPMRGSERSGPHTGYVPTYYPGTATLEGARPVSVRAGQDTEGADIALVAGALGRVTVTMTDSRGAQISARGGYASLSSRNSPLLGGRGGMWMPDGSYVFTDVPPGDYYVTANLNRGEGAAAEREGAFAPVTVNGGDVTVSLRTNKGATLSGKVVFEGTFTSPPPLTPNVPVRVPPDALRPMVMVRPASMQGSPTNSWGTPERVGEDGAFRITGVRGSVLLTCGSAAAAVKAIRYAGQDLSTTPLELSGTETIDDIEVVLTYDTGNVLGTVTDDRGRPIPGAWVVIFPEDAKRWTPGNPFVRPTRALDERVLRPNSMRPGPPAGGAAAPGATGARLPRQPGEFFATRLLPGGYYLAVVKGESNGSLSMQFDAETLSALRAKATKVTVAVGETATVTVTQ